MNARTVQVLGVERPHKMYVWSHEDHVLTEGQFRVDTLYSGFSAGTELTFVKGSNPYLSSRWDAGYGVFLQGQAGAAYPVPVLGYMEVGQVVASRNPAVPEGSLVGMAYGHKTGHDADPARDFYVLLPNGIEPMAGIWAAQMGPICANGVLHAAAEAVGSDVRALGDGVAGRCVLVYGGGVVGALTALFARRHGAAEVAVADGSVFRRERLARLGLTALPEADAWRWCKDRWLHGPGERGADVVFQCKASAAALHDSLRALRPQGTAIDLAFYQGGAGELRLGEEFHHNGLTVRCAQIGRVPRGTAHAWSRARLARETVALLLEDGPLILSSLVTHTVALAEAAQFVGHLVHARPDFLQVVFDMRTSR